MTEATLRGGIQSDAAPGSSPSITLTRGDITRLVIVALLAVGVIAAAYFLINAPDRGAASSYSWLTGVLLGAVIQRGRFCFFCIFRDHIEERNSAPLFAVLAALAVGAIGYAVVFGAFLPNTTTGRLPPDAHIGPVSWVLVAAGVAFGIGMALSGACISGHLYRLGEGYSRAPIALFGSLIGFGLGFFSWQRLYVDALASAPVAWLPGTFGYGGALALTLAALTLIGILLLRTVPALKPGTGGKITARRLYETVFRDRWNPLITGGIVGVIGVFAYFRVEPLGVTAQLGSLSRTALDNAGLLSGRLNGLDTFAGCATLVVQTITDNGFLIVGLVIGSFAMALLANKFQPSRLTVRNSATALIGGILMGWGSMLALGCTVGTLLSGISAFALSGWVFFAAVFAGVWLGVRLKLHKS